MSRVKTVVYALSGLVLTSAATVYGLLPAGAATAGPIKGLGSKCIDVAGAATANGTAVQLYDCNNSAAQQWTADGTLQALGKCLDVTAAGTTNGTKIQLYECNGTGAQNWTLTGGALVNPASGKCLDVTGGSTANGTRLQIWTCTGGAGQAWTLPGSAGTGKNLDDPAKKDVAMQIVSAAENSSLNWRAQFSYIEDINDGRGYTAGIIGFCSGTGDMLELVEAYTAASPSNVLAKYLPALRSVNGTASHAGLDPNFTRDWRTAAADPAFQAAQEAERDRVYFNPSVRDGKADGVRALGQFAYYDAAVVHGYSGMRSIRSRALAKAKPPAQGGDERAWLTAFLNERVIEMKKEPAHEDVTRIDTAQRVFLNNGNFDLNTPLDFKVYGDSFHIS
ncbi:putative glycosyl hydrolase [Actinoplanes missouriensis 431]|uniref:Putative glycosyl hydrolase n=1 Tax=Actinoplanes missouriensis (strain ATCC 14538 / DSM 43046 / CBS 188.64 / JCM 3121 / NBRC 102363 / NCIMB 12654 / NRRL B-3342 / UNCC 431) TaxID=512565 RepID=I0HDZ8_ACTM4|nr:chitosanase [Actinoplanes missouriensis]BAL91235.1 putative glycosyl hydrolase [Actinoplanes missouriensis 431]